MTLCAWIQSKWAVVAQLALVAVLGFCVAKFVDGMPVEKHDVDIIGEWNHAIEQLGIEPVFPPEEDIFVGDVFAVITKDRRPDDLRTTTRSTRLKRAVKIHSESMIATLIGTYNEMPLFPSTKKRPTEEGVAWEVEPKSEGIFQKADKRGYLALAAFPGFTIKSDNSGSLGGSGFGSLFGWSGHDTNSIELRIPFVETYGIPSYLATVTLEQLCADKLAPVCSDDALRRQLENITGPLRDKTVNPETGEVIYQVDVELVFVTRVYIARSIEQKYGSGSWRTFGASYNTSALSSSNGSEPPKIEPSADGQPKGAMRQDSSSEAGSELRQVFQRPLVIGYRAVKKSFTTDLAEAAKKNSKVDPGKDAP